MVKQICFMVMPYGVKATGVETGAGPEKVDFNALWQQVFLPAISSLGYQPVRADIELGPLIITDMIQRLAISDLVVADISIANANVYYEIGVRHAARETGCVVVAADWSKPVFDLAQVRHIRYPLPVEKLEPADAETSSKFLTAEIRRCVSGKSPVYDAVPGYPAPDVTRAQAFSDLMEKVAAFQGRVATTSDMPPGQDREACAFGLRDEYLAAQPILPAVAIELLYLLRDTTDWKTTLEYVDALPEDIRKIDVVREQRALAQSKTGNHLDAIAALRELIKLRGLSSERAGLIGGRYKKLYRETLKANPPDTGAAAKYLDLAIDWYTAGMDADLNDFYPTSNLPRLLRTRGRTGDEQRARVAAAVTRAACDRTLARTPSHPWVRQTLLGQAVDAADLATVARLVAEVAANPGAPWQLNTTDEDLRMSLALLPLDVRPQYEEILRQLPLPK